MKMNEYYAPFSIWRTMKKVAYCNNEVIPLLEKKKIDWDMNTKRIIIRGKRFPMKDIDNGDAEEFINSLISEDGQTTLRLFKEE